MMGHSVGMRCLLVLTLISKLTITDAVDDIGYFWHVTDFHYDYTYSDQLESCDSAHLPSNPGKYGDFWCDSPWSLINSSVHAMARLEPNADFMLWTGDSILHYKDNEHSYEKNAAILQNITDVLQKTLPKVPVYATYGNHDYYPDNQFPPHGNQLYNDSWVRWEDWVDDETQADDFRKGGYYTVKNKHGLRIVALNTNLYYTLNKASLNEADPADQLQWLNKTLRAARTNGDKVICTAHIPPGVHTPRNVIWMYEKFHVPLVEILRHFTDVIVGMHFGHDHSDGFKALRGTYGQQSVSPIFMAPSVTPWRNIVKNKIGPAHHPGIRLVKYNRATGVALDIKQYYLDLTKANRVGKADWELEYTFSNIYGTENLSGASILSVANELKQDTNGHKLNKFWQHFTVSPPIEMLEECNDDCRRSIVCGYTNFDMNSFEACKNGMISGATSWFVSANVFVGAIGCFLSTILAYY